MYLTENYQLNSLSFIQKATATFKENEKTIWKGLVHVGVCLYIYIDVYAVKYV